MRNLAIPLVRKGASASPAYSVAIEMITGINAIRRHLFPRGPNSVDSRTFSPFPSRLRVAGWSDDQPRDDDDGCRDQAAGREDGREREPKQTL